MKKHDNCKTDIQAEQTSRSEQSCGSKNIICRLMNAQMKRDDVTNRETFKREDGSKKEGKDESK